MPEYNNLIKLYLIKLDKFKNFGQKDTWQQNGFNLNTCIGMKHSLICLEIVCKQEFQTCLVGNDSCEISKM